MPSTSPPFKGKYSSKISSIISHVNQTEWNNDVKEKIFPLSRGFFQLHNFPARQHNRNRREITTSDSSNGLKGKMASRHCDESVNGFLKRNCKVSKNLTVVFKHTKQSFSQLDYGVVFGRLKICSTKLNLSCNDYLVEVKYGKQYKIWKRLPLSYNKRIHHPNDYRLNDDIIEMCACNDSRIQAIWRWQNSCEKKRNLFECLAQDVDYRIEKNYAVNEKLTICLWTKRQYFTRNDYVLANGKLCVCKEKLKPESREYTKEDLSTCND